MPGRKYEKYIQTDLVLPASVQEGDREHNYYNRATRILWLEDEIIKGAFSVICSWYWKETDGEGSPSHDHDFDEVLCFLGGDPENPSDLGGEVEYWMEDEKYILNKSCLIYVPTGLRHCPLNVLKVERPFMFLAISLTGKYLKNNVIKGYR